MQDSPSSTHPTPSPASGERVGATAIPSLTGIRGVAAFYVFLTHAQIVLATYLARPAINDNGFLYNGFRGVDLFFVLSGFILMHVHENDFATLRREQAWRFYVLRFFRVYPLNALILLALVPLVLALPGFVDWTRFAHGAPIRYHDHDFSALGFAQSLLLAQCWSVIKPGQWNGPAWSLSAEVFGYASFPLLAWVAVRCRSAALAAVVAAASLLALIAAIYLCHHAADNPTASFGLVRMGCCFVAGIALQRCFRFWEAGAAGASALAMLSAAWIMLCLLWRPLNVFVVLGFGGIILGLAYRRGPVNAALESPLALFLGRISFSFYVVHYIPLRLSLWLFQTRLHDTPLWLRAGYLVALFGFCVGAATVLQRWFELPCQRLARRVLRAERPARERQDSRRFAPAPR